MTLKETLAQLEALGTEKMRAQNSKHGAGKNQFGVRLGDIRKVAKQVKADHKLAMALWKTKNIDGLQGLHLAVRADLDQRNGEEAGLT